MLYSLLLPNLEGEETKNLCASSFAEVARTYRVLYLDACKESSQKWYRLRAFVREMEGTDLRLNLSQSKRGEYETEKVVSILKEWGVELVA